MFRIKSREDEERQFLFSLASRAMLEFRRGRNTVGMVPAEQAIYALADSPMTPVWRIESLALGLAANVMRAACAGDCYEMAYAAALLRKSCRCVSGSPDGELFPSFGVGVAEEIYDRLKSAIAYSRHSMRTSAVTAAEMFRFGVDLVEDAYAGEGRARPEEARRADAALSLLMAVESYGIRDTRSAASFAHCGVRCCLPIGGDAVGDDGADDPLRQALSDVEETIGREQVAEKKVRDKPSIRQRACLRCSLLCVFDRLGGKRESPVERTPVVEGFLHCARRDLSQRQHGVLPRARALVSAVCG